MIVLHGVVLSGLGEGARFMALGWVRDAVRELTGFDPYPGTLNVRLVDAGAVAAWRRIRRGPALRLAPPSPAGCGADLVRLVIEPRIEAAAIVPDVTRHGGDVLELIAAVNVRARLGLADDGALTLRVPPPR